MKIEKKARKTLQNKEIFYEAGLFKWQTRGVGEDMIHAICSHGYGLCSDVEPEHEMEKVLFAADELTGLIGAAAPDASVKEYEGYGSIQPEEEIQGQEVCSGLLP